MNDKAARKACAQAGAGLLVLGTMLLLAGLISPRTAEAQSVKVAATPPMGWNSWNKFGCDVSDKLIREMADAVVGSGMKDAGYRFVNIDDCWQVGRDGEKRLG